MYILVSPFSKTFDFNGLIYFVPDFLNSEVKIGQIVEIPIKTSIEIAVVLGFFNDIDSVTYKDKIKPIISIKNKNIFLIDYQFELIKYISEFYYTPIHNSVRLFFPANLRSKIDKDKVPFNDSNDNSKVIFKYDKKLTKKQELIYSQIKEEKEKNVLLFGVTGSGKTEIYIKLIKDCLDKGKQSLFLIPEIILSTQIGEKIKKVFGEEVIVITSNTTEATKTKYWLKIHSGEAKIILGTRSSLFYPYKNLGLIIVDEEHDNSYISDSAPRYKTVEVVNKISEINNTKIILGSGTPSIKTMYEGINGKYKILNLFEKYKN